MEQNIENSNTLLLVQDFKNTPPVSSLKVTPNGSYNENVSLFINALALITSGICQFHFKLTKLHYPNDYEEYSYCFWRYFFSAIVNYPIMRYNNSSLIPFQSLRSNLWFWVRTIDQFFVFETYLFILCFFRTSTATCFVSMAPAVILVLSSLLLGEKFYMRYIYGIIICFVGVLFIVSNEKSTNKEETTFYVILMGSFWGIVQLITVALHRVSSKMLIKEHIDEDTQIMYTSYVNCILPIIFLIFFGKKLSFGFGFVVNCAINGALWVLFTRLLVLSLKGVELSKTTAIGYITVVTVFLLGVLFLGESIYFTDILGSLMILGFNIFNSVYPVKE